jgi:hypothetical protein
MKTTAICMIAMMLFCASTAVSFAVDCEAAYAALRAFKLMRGFDGRPTPKLTRAEAQVIFTSLASHHPNMRFIDKAIQSATPSLIEVQRERGLLCVMSRRGLANVRPQLRTEQFSGDSSPHWS